MKQPMKQSMNNPRINPWINPSNTLFDLNLSQQHIFFLQYIPQTVLALRGSYFSSIVIARKSRLGSLEIGCALRSSLALARFV